MCHLRLSCQTPDKQGNRCDKGCHRASYRALCYRPHKTHSYHNTSLIASLATQNLKNSSFKNLNFCGKRIWTSKTGYSKTETSRKLTARREEHVSSRSQKATPGADGCSKRHPERETETGTQTTKLNTGVRLIIRRPIANEPGVRAGRRDSLTRVGAAVAALELLQLALQLLLSTALHHRLWV